MSQHTILIADDNEQSRTVLEDLLFTHYRLVTASNGLEAVEAAKKHRPSLALVDLQMPKMDGVEVCKKIRSFEETRNMPIIMISGMGSEARRTEAFLSGIDDFIAKPFSGQELMARILSKLSWQRQLIATATTEGPKLGNLSIDERRLCAVINGQSLKLTHFEYTLLKYLLQNADTVLSREKILNDVWQSSSVSTRTVDTHIYTLRQKLSQFDHEIQTVHGAGYMLKLRVSGPK